MNTGLRLDHHNEYGSEITPHVALNKKFNEDSNVYLSWGKVFNAPNVQDLYWKQYDSDYNSWTLGDPNLKPEKGEVWTLGTNMKISEKTIWLLVYFIVILKMRLIGNIIQVIIPQKQPI